MLAITQRAKPPRGESRTDPCSTSKSAATSLLCSMPPTALHTSCEAPVEGMQCQPNLGGRAPPGHALAPAQSRRNAYLSTMSLEAGHDAHVGVDKSGPASAPEKRRTRSQPICGGHAFDRWDMVVRARRRRRGSIAQRAWQPFADRVLQHCLTESVHRSGDVHHHDHNTVGVAASRCGSAASRRTGSARSARHLVRPAMAHLKDDFLGEVRRRGHTYASTLTAIRSWGHSLMCIAAMHTSQAHVEHVRVIPKAPNFS